MHRARLEVYCSVAQHHSRRGGSGSAECRTAEGEGISRVITSATTAAPKHGEIPHKCLTSSRLDRGSWGRQMRDKTQNNRSFRRCSSVIPCARGERLEIGRAHV